MTDQNLTHIYFLLDRSGSMQSIRGATVEGFGAFIAEQQSTPGVCKVTLAQFDDQYDEVYADLDLAAVPPLELNPRGSTALLDSLGRLIVTAGERLAALPEERRPESVVVGVMTDGYENASVDWDHPRIRSLIEQQTDDYGWQFLYLGADQDAIEVGARMGFKRDKAMTYSRGRSRQAMAAMSSNVAAYRSAKAAGLSEAQADVLTNFKVGQRDDAAR